MEFVPRLLTLFNLLVLVGLSACADSPDFIPTTVTPGAAAPAAGRHTLSPEAVHVSQIALRNGDRNYLMLDKAHGKIFVFENGAPTFSGAALTGENPADVLSSDAIGKTFAEQKGLKYKVTPAGR